MSPEIGTSDLRSRLSEISKFFGENKTNCLICLIVAGILILSLGILLMGKDLHPFLGSRMIIFGSGIFYISVVLLVFILD